MPSFSHSVEIPKPPSEVFPWLLEQDKVPQWTSDLERYDVEGPLGVGTRVTQKLERGGRDRARRWRSRRSTRPAAPRRFFETNGVKVSSGYVLEASGAGTRLTQTLEAKASGLTARMLIPVVQGRLETKLKSDLDTLRDVLGG